MSKFHSFRVRLTQILEPAENGAADKVSFAYDIAMVVAIVVGILPLMFKHTTPVLNCLENFSLVLFIVDYLLRWFTADIHGKRKGWLAFVVYPFTVGAIVDLLSILPSLLKVLNPSFKLFRLSRLFKILRFFRLIRYYEPLQIIMSVLRKEGRTLLAVVGLALTYIFITALVMFNAEYEIELAGGRVMFNTIFDAIYWSACTLTTVGYGDIYPVSTIGRVISMVSAIVGVAVVALPSGIITAGYMDELHMRRKLKDEARQIKHDNNSN
ncbi:MAG: ion transporter [Marinilabiliaceae bacterium]